MDPTLSEQTRQGKPVPEMVVPEIETDSKTAISSASPTSKPQVQLAVDELGKGDDGNAPPDGEISPIRDPMAAKVFRGVLEDSFLEYWWAEILASLIMLLALMAIILILALHQGHTLPSWPFTITLNSLISIMVVILKATMLAILASGLGQLKWLWFEKPRPLSHYGVYDKAAQGPRFASQLLWVLRGKQLIACAGLAVIILAVALDPFSQQVIQFYVTYTPSPKSNATLPRTTVYSISGVHIGAALAPLDTPMEGAIMAGFYTPGSDAYTVEVSNCLTGNCSFPVQYRTIGMCHGCYEVTEFVTGHCSYSSPDANGSATASLQDGCTYALPSNTSITQSGYSDPQWLAGVSGPPGSIIPPAPEGNIWQWETIFTTQDINTTCANTACPNSTCTGAACGAAAMECYFQPCINTYNATVAKGTFNEYLIASEPIPYTYNSSAYQSACWTNLRKDCLNAHDWKILNSQGINATTYANAEYIPYCNSDISILSNEGFSNDCVYEFFEESYFPFLQFFTGFMVGNVSGQQQNGVTGPPDLNFLYNYGAITVDTVNATFASMASTMSARMRVSGNTTYSAPAQGEILETLTLIRVAWAWLALPVALVALTLIFMVAVIIQTFINGRRPIGKTFSLGLLLTGVAGTVGDEFADLKYLHEAITDLSGVKDAHAPIVKAATEAKIQIKGEGSVKKLIKV
ncbi:hypothetical protein L207DRAFT_527156 [Hyaloscypha variabilis F]|uniref:Uncharacterized protein n=1 Tax=Hyaloscypha variabilis (strain UAMH 11265 / GT02V1 / F) TaxID=1149755 RepID=A0A2J6RUT4_HYAVF|nr:hypothetical protein L207DRAFT_527156 [Hyaloscypha variabilis F]